MIVQFVKRSAMLYHKVVRKDMLDEAMLRPGRILPLARPFALHIIALPLPLELALLLRRSSVGLLGRRRCVVFVTFFELIVLCFLA